jgi:hypothetical protein
MALSRGLDSVSPALITFIFAIVLRLLYATGTTKITELKRAEQLQARRARQTALRADIHSAFSAGTEGALSIMLQRSAEAVVRHLDAAFARIWTLNKAKARS